MPFNFNHRAVLVFLLTWLSSLNVCNASQTLPEGFVFLTDIDSTIIESPRYYGSENFVGRRVEGYTTPRIICTKEAAKALSHVSAELSAQGYTLVVYDGYRPQRAVNHFKRWSEDISDQRTKALYYPQLAKDKLFDLGYIAEKSSHSRGSTFDLTIIPNKQFLKPIKVKKRRLSNGETIPFLDDNTVDMGSSFDLFNEASHHDSSLITAEQTIMRELLRNVMKQNGFLEYKEEWWHYTLEDEPYPNTYFDFVVQEKN